MTRSCATTLKRWGEKLALNTSTWWWAPGGNSKCRQSKLHQVTKFKSNKPVSPVKTDRFYVHDSYKESRPLMSLVMPLRKSEMKLVHATISLKSLKFSLHKWCIPFGTGMILHWCRSRAYLGEWSLHWVIFLSQLANKVVKLHHYLFSRFEL